MVDDAERPAPAARTPETLDALLVVLAAVLELARLTSIHTPERVAHNLHGAVPRLPRDGWRVRFPDAKLLAGYTEGVHDAFRDLSPLLPGIRRRRCHI